MTRARNINPSLRHLSGGRMAGVACYLVLARVPSIRNFDSITLLFSNHTLDIGVKENNRVTLSKS
jgi:hypothetical protein